MAESFWSDKDVRPYSLPCVFMAAVLQYIRFAKKPMSAPLHCISERRTRQLLLVGLLLEIIGLRLMPLCEAYAINSTCLVLLYFVKESKRAGQSIDFLEVIACASAAMAWTLPLLDPVGDAPPEIFKVATLIDLVLGPVTCGYVIALLVLAIVVQILFGSSRNSLLMCIPPALNFGFSAICLKALAQFATWMVESPFNPVLWIAFMGLFGLILVIRSAAAGPLKRALEVHDALSVLASYGMASSVSAAMSGEIVFGEMSHWSWQRQSGYIMVTMIYCWGLRMLATRSAVEHRFEPVAKSDPDCLPAPVQQQRGGRMGNSKTSSPMVKPTKAESPLVPLSMPSNSTMQPPDDDSDIEDRLFAAALGGLANTTEDPWSGAAPKQGPRVGPLGGDVHFDADFEEIMRRFNDDGPPATGAAVVGAPQISQLDTLDLGIDLGGPAEVVVDGAGCFDVDTLLDINYGTQADDEDELLKGIADTDGLGFDFS